jgi:hypothetical protein
MANVNISPEYLKKIRSFAAIKPDEEFIYVPKAYREFPSDLQPKFTLKVIAGDELVKSEDVLKGSYSYADGRSVLTFQRGEFAVVVCRKGIVGWENYYDAHGTIIPYSNNISELSPDMIFELCNAITERTRLQDEEVLGLK